MPLRLAVALIAMAAHAQWLDYPTQGVPRTPGGLPDLEAPAPRTPEGKPDFSGLWGPDTTGAIPSEFGGLVLPRGFTNIEALLPTGLPYRPEGRAVVAARRAEFNRNNPDGRCLPLSILQMHSNLFPRRILQVPGYLAILYEKNMLYRQIFTDGRPLPEDPQPAFFGYSSAKWDGDTLVVETIGLRDDSYADGGGNLLTDAARITERFRRPVFGRMEIQLTVNDPKAYTAPWTVTINQVIKLDTELLEYACLENQQYAPGKPGK